MYEEEVYAVVGSTHPTTDNTIQSYSNALHMPVVLATPTHSSNDNLYHFDVSLYPPLIDAVINVVSKDERKQKIYYIYETDGGK